MKNLKLLTILLFLSAGPLWSQNDYIVKTSPQRSTASTAEERFIEDNFPFHSLCSWSPGMKFMFILEEKFGFIPIFSSYETDEHVDNSHFQHKVLTFQGVEEKQMETDKRTSFSTRFLFELDGRKYYHEIKNQRLNEICLKSPRAHIKGLVYLGDVDKARELLMNRVIYTKTNRLRVDDSNSGNGFREVDMPANLKGTVTAVGVGNRESPVKIVFDDNTGRSYYLEVALSTTNSGYVKSDFQGERLMKFFPNAFNFTDQHAKTVGEIKERYMDKYIYPTVNLDAKIGSKSTVLFRFTPLKIADIDVNPNQIQATLYLLDNAGNTYSVPVSLKYDVIMKNADYINDLFGVGNLRAEYPYITDDNWALIVNGEVALGMTKDECRLSLGSPVQIVANLNSRYETWFYNGRVLDFDEGKLARIR